MKYNLIKKLVCALVLTCTFTATAGCGIKIGDKKFHIETETNDNSENTGAFSENLDGSNASADAANQVSSSGGKNTIAAGSIEQSYINILNENKDKQYGIGDMDGDGISELFIISKKGNDTAVAVYSYSNGKTVNLGTETIQYVTGESIGICSSGVYIYTGDNSSAEMTLLSKNGNKLERKNGVESYASIVASIIPFSISKRHEDSYIKNQIYYTPLVQKAFQEMKSSANNPACGYMYYDIDKDGTDELIVCSKTSENEPTGDINFYTIADGKAQKIHEEHWNENRASTLIPTENGLIWNGEYSQGVFCDKFVKNGNTITTQEVNSNSIGKPKQKIVALENLSPYAH